MGPGGRQPEGPYDWRAGDRSVVVRLVAAGIASAIIAVIGIAAGSVGLLILAILVNAMLATIVLVRVHRWHVVPFKEHLCVVLPARILDVSPPSVSAKERRRFVSALVWRNGKRMGLYLERFVEDDGRVATPWQTGPVPFAHVPGARPQRAPRAEYKSLKGPTSYLLTMTAAVGLGFASGYGIPTVFGNPAFVLVATPPVLLLAAAATWRWQRRSLRTGVILVCETFSDLHRRPDAAPRPTTPTYDRWSDP
jgi:hypothetical protein